jgi:hypothetical protein
MVVLLAPATTCIQGGYENDGLLPQLKRFIVTEFIQLNRKNSHMPKQLSCTCGEVDLLDKQTSKHKNEIGSRCMASFPLHFFLLFETN